MSPSWMLQASNVLSLGSLNPNLDTVDKWTIRWTCNWLDRGLQQELLSSSMFN